MFMVRYERWVGSQRENDKMNIYCCEECGMKVDILECLCVGVIGFFNCAICKRIVNAHKENYYVFRESDYKKWLENVKRN